MIYITNLACSQILVDYGADVNMPNADGVAPIHLAAADGNIPLIRTLVKGINSMFLALNGYQMPMARPMG